MAKKTNKKQNTQRTPNGKFAKGNTIGNRFTETNQPPVENVRTGRRKQIAKEKEIEKTVDIVTRILQKLVKDKQGNELSAKEAMLLALLQRALKGEIKAIELIIKLIGEMPSDKIDVKTLGFNVMVADAEHKKMLEEL